MHLIYILHIHTYIQGSKDIPRGAKALPPAEDKVPTTGGNGGAAGGRGSKLAAYDETEGAAPVSTNSAAAGMALAVYINC